MLGLHPLPGPGGAGGDDDDDDHHHGGGAPLLAIEDAPSLEVVAIDGEDGVEYADRAEIEELEGHEHAEEEEQCDDDPVVDADHTGKKEEEEAVMSVPDKVEQTPSPNTDLPGPTQDSQLVRQASSSSIDTDFSTPEGKPGPIVRAQPLLTPRKLFVDETFKPPTPLLMPEDRARVIEQLRLGAL